MATDTLRRHIQVGLAANASLRVTPAAMIDFLSDLPLDATIVLRCGNTTRPGWFERLCAKVCESLWLGYEWIMPDLRSPTRSGNPRGATFERDVAFAGMCDVVLTFFDGETADPTSGTWHIVEKCLDQHVPVYAYGWDGSRFKRIGEWDEMDTWGEMAPRL